MAELPLYHRVSLVLRDRIVNGAYNWQQPMPSETTLCSEFKVSRGTIRRAFVLLEEDGLIERRQGARTYAKALGYRASQQRQNLNFIANDQKHLELFAGDINQEYKPVKPDRLLAKQFPGQATLGRIERVRNMRGKPYCLVVTYLPLTIADKIQWRSLGDTPVITAVSAVGYDFVKTEQVITAVVADEVSASALAVPVASPLLCVSGLFIDAAGVAVIRKDGYFRPESFEYRMTLHKNGSLLQ